MKKLSNYVVENNYIEYVKRAIYGQEFTELLMLEYIANRLLKLSNLIDSIG